MSRAIGDQVHRLDLQRVDNLIAAKYNSSPNETCIGVVGIRVLFLRVHITASGSAYSKSRPLALLRRLCVRLQILGTEQT